MGPNQQRLTNYNRMRYEQQPVNDWSDPVYEPEIMTTGIEGLADQILDRRDGLVHAKISLAPKGREKAKPNPIRSLIPPKASNRRRKRIFKMSHFGKRGHTLALTLVYSFTVRTLIVPLFLYS
ncbi:hypothetical protein QAD02_006676 [Eretmocerus hayati]|uniref:Uncharacterized protein n=1 Tax=Eretmocerus hayati TaxID=131215 RepID=A0ACC2N3X9_9HYME|nr:hypothetical protein QAD02_006676 [Eretmocerus hayati]